MHKAILFYYGHFIALAKKPVVVIFFETPVLSTHQALAVALGSGAERAKSEPLAATWQATVLAVPAFPRVLSTDEALELAAERRSFKVCVSVHIPAYEKAAPLL